MAVKQAKADLVRGMVYPVPDPRYPFLGVHFTRRVSGALEVGPNAVLALGREAYGRRSEVKMGDVRSMVTWPGFWRMARTHWRTGVREVRGSLSMRVYMREAQRYVPEIGAADVVRGGSGIRAQAVDRDGSLVDDFRITESDGVLCVRNAPSPAATSSLAIAEHVVARVR
jgi:L-2-hydroxyglutarate oxidase LhgO